MGHACKRPDPAAMERLLERHPISPEGAILRLAWLEGLSRGEIAALTWSQVDLDAGLLRLPDREIPLDEQIVHCLRTRFQRYGHRDSHVVISDRYKKPMPPESVSRLARVALNAEGLDVGLMDLRHDFVIRRIETDGWPTAARLSGMAVSTLRDVFAPYLPASPREKSAPAPQDTEYLLWRVLQQEGSSAVGLTLWMTWQLLLSPGEILALTWDQIDLAAGVLCLPDRTVPTGSRLSRMLREARDRRPEGAAPHVIVAPTTGRPMELARLSTVTRTALIRGGLEHMNLRDLSLWARRQEQYRAVLALAETDGFVTREAVMSAVPAPRSTAQQLLRELTDSGRLIRVGARCYLPGRVVPPEAQETAVLDYLRTHGSACRKDFTALLNIAPKQVTLLLRRMADRGLLALDGKRYRLPDVTIKEQQNS